MTCLILRTTWWHNGEQTLHPGGPSQDLEGGQGSWCEGFEKMASVDSPRENSGGSGNRVT